MLLRPSAFRSISTDRETLFPAIGILVTTMVCGIAGIWGALALFGPSAFSMLPETGVSPTAAARTFEEQALPITLTVSNLAVLLGFPLWPVFVHVVARGISGPTIDFGVTFRVVCFANIICVLGLFFYIPNGIGTFFSIAALLWSIAGTIIGLKAAHSISTIQSLGIVVISTILFGIMDVIIICTLALPLLQGVVV